jgi:hypothetical protein
VITAHDSRLVDAARHALRCSLRIPSARAARRPGSAATAPGAHTASSRYANLLDDQTGARRDAADDPPQEATGKVPAGGGTITFEIETFEIEKDDPQNPTGDRFTGERFDKALNVTLNSVVFRSSGQDLTTSGTCIEMASRVTEPVLLGLAILAVRNRAKR